MIEQAEIERRAERIKLLLMDCDGVLTDGRITLLENSGRGGRPIHHGVMQQA
jgi:hypothetical protein